MTAGLLSASPAAADTDLPDPAVHYDFDADATTTDTIADISGNDRHGTLTNGATAALVEGADGGTALNLPGGSPNSDGAYVQLPVDVLSGATDLTVSARVNWSGTPANWQWIYALGTNNTRYVFTTPYNNNGLLRTAISQGGGSAENQNTGSAALPAGEWRTVTVTLDTDAGRLTTYLDGAAVDSTPTPLTAGDLLQGSPSIAGYIGRSFYPDPLFEGAVDDFRVYHSALSEEQIAELTLGDVPSPTGLSQDTFDTVTPIGTPPNLPEAAPGSFSDGYDRPVAIAWDEVDPDDYADSGRFTVSGTAGEWPVTANVTVVREGQLTVDLASSTGDVFGGASGSLYGLYGPGLPTDNLVEGMNLRTIATKAQDGPQHPGSDALEVVETLVDTTGGEVYIYMTDIHRGFPYQWPGDTPEEKLELYKEKIAVQVDQVLELDRKYQDHIVFAPFNEPEGNMFGTGEWSYNGVSWLNNPTDYFAAWDDVYALIKEKMPHARIGGPNTSILYNQVRGYMEHVVEAGTVPDVMLWHELSHPEAIRTSVAQYRQWEREVFAGTEYEGTELPINLTEYAYRYHLSVPGLMVPWIAAIEDTKVDADLAFWNINSNLSDTTVQANRANGQWWLFNAYASMTGHTVEVTPPSPGVNYTLQGLASFDEEKAQARTLFGGADGPAWIQFDNVPEDLFGTQVHAWIREIPWTGQIGDSAQPEVVAETVVEVTDGTVGFDFGGSFPELDESSAYEIVLSPAGDGAPTAVPPKLWQGSFEAEDAEYTGSGYSLNGPEGSPSNLSSFHTSGGYNVGGLRTGSDGVLDFTVEVPEDGTYDLRVFASSLNTYDLIEEQGPTNVFLRVNGEEEQELFLPLGYQWVVWDHTETTVELEAGENVISLAAQSLDGDGATQGDAIIDRVTLALPNPEAATVTYEAELAWLDGATPVYRDELIQRHGASGSGAVEVGDGDRVTFWVYSAEDAEATIDVHTLGTGRANLAVNGHDIGRVGPASTRVAVSLSGGINKVTLTGMARRPALVDRIDVTPTDDHLASTVYQAEDARLDGDTEVTELSLASTGAAVTGIGGEPGNGNTLTFDVEVPRDGTYAMRVRYSNPEMSPPTHYNPNPVARRADISVNGADSERVLFPPSFHANNFWDLTVPVELRQGANTIAFASEEQPNFDGESYASDNWPGITLRSPNGPVVDNITIAEYSSGRLGRP